MVVSPRVGVLALQGGVREHLEFLEKVGAQAVRVRKVGELSGLDGLIIPGGESTTISKLLVALDLYQPIDELIKEGLPTWGTCAGMILLADHVEGAVEGQVSFKAIDATVKRNAFGSQTQSHEELLKIKGLDAPVHGVFIRAPIVVQVGPEVEVLGRSTRRREDGEEPIVAIAQGSVLATSFHPELSDDTAMHRFFLDNFVRNSPVTNSSVTNSPVTQGPAAKSQA